MLKRSDFLALGFYKKEKFTGSDAGMRFRVEKDGDELLVTIWPEPFSFDNTPDEQKQCARFPFGEEGLCDAVEWLNRQHEEQLPLWKNAPFFVSKEE